jgi:predicted phosphodiesterase
MYVDTVYIPYKKLDEQFKILPISDIHYGHKSCDVKKLKKDLSERVDDKTIILGLGDWADSIIVTDKRYRKEDDGTPSGAILDDQVNGLYEIFKPYAKQIYGIGDGNHEDVVHKKCNSLLMPKLCAKLATEDHKPLWLGYSWLLELVFYVDLKGQKTQTRGLIVRGHHGWGGGARTEGADITKFSHDVKFWQADLFLYGHTHRTKLNDLEVGMKVGKSGWRTQLKRMAVCGTYQRTYSNTQIPTWAETKGFPPVSIRTPIIWAKPHWQSGVELRVEH